MKIIIHYFCCLSHWLQRPDAIRTIVIAVNSIEYPAPEFEGDPTAEYIEANVDFDTQISQENSDPDTFYTYFCLCNASDHKIYFTLTFCPTKNCLLFYRPYEWACRSRKIYRILNITDWSMDRTGSYHHCFSSYYGDGKVYYDVDDKYGPVRFPSGMARSRGNIQGRILRSVMKAKSGFVIGLGSGFNGRLLVH